MSRRLITDLAPETKLAPLLYLFDAVVLLCGVALFLLTNAYFSFAWMRTLYGGLIFIACVWAVLRPKHNPFKRNYQVLLFAFKRDHHVYSMVNKHEDAYYDKELLVDKNSNIQFDLTAYNEKE